MEFKVSALHTLFWKTNKASFKTRTIDYQEL